ncbi:MAG TPA: hypothetical protein VHS09_02435, partial [Polyangiaceae bacterium]|nr:hypothetical protein [Polyangiaceae bacterium]
MPRQFLDFIPPLAFYGRSSHATGDLSKIAAEREAAVVGKRTAHDRAKPAGDVHWRLRTLFAQLQPMAFDVHPEASPRALQQRARFDALRTRVFEEMGRGAARRR